MRTNKSIVEKLNVEKLKTMVGVFLLRFGRGFLSSWPAISVYFYSYFAASGRQITPRMTVLCILSNSIAMLVANVVSPTITAAIQHRLLLKVSALIIVVSMVIGVVNLDLPTVISLIIILPNCLLAIGDTVAMRHLWSYYSGNSQGTATGFALAGTHFGAAVWNLLFMVLVNPRDDPAVLNVRGILQFPSQDIRGLPSIVTSVVSVVALLILLGSFLVSHHDNIHSQLLSHHRQDEHIQDHINEGHQDIAVELQAIQEIPNSIELNASRSLSGHRRRSSLAVSHVDELIDLDQSNLQVQNSIWSYCHQPSFVCLILTESLLNVTFFYFRSSPKTAFIDRFEDDWNMDVSLMGYELMALVGTIFAGIVSDQVGPRRIVFVLSCLSVVMQTWTVCSEHRTSVLIGYCMMGLCERGLHTAIGLSLVSSFGIDKVSPLLQARNFLLSSSTIVAPAIVLLLNGRFYIQNIEFLLMSISILALPLVILALISHPHKKTETSSLSVIN